MKRIKPFISIFFATFLIGYVSVPSTNKLSIVNNVEISKETFAQEGKLYLKGEIISYASAKKFAGSELLDKDHYEDNSKYEFDLLETGEFHGDEVEAKSGETWLGFFAENNMTFLRKTKIKVRRVYDSIVDGNPKRKTGKKVSVKGKNKPIFLLKNADSLKF